MSGFGQWDGKDGKQLVAEIKDEFFPSYAHTSAPPGFDDMEVIAAGYGGGYDGEALVVFRVGGKLYEVNGSHCSCYGLEDQWDPEETSLEALRHRRLDLFMDGTKQALQHAITKLQLEKP